MCTNLHKLCTGINTKIETDYHLLKKNRFELSQTIYESSKNVELRLILSAYPCKRIKNDHAELFCKLIYFMTIYLHSIIK